MIIELLEDIRRRPSIYLGGDESQRARQLQNLEHLVSGYTLALRAHAIQEPVKDFLREFSDFLWKRKGLSVSRGVAAAVRAAAQSEQEAWDLFWTFVDEFVSGRNGQG